MLYNQQLRVQGHEFRLHFQSLQLRATKTKLEQQNIELIKAMKLKEDVENIIHHDVKSPLSVVILNAQLLKEKENTVIDIRKKAKIIEKAGYRILDIIDRSLDLYKMEQGVYNYKIEQVNVSDLLSRITEEISSLFTNKAIKSKLLFDGFPLSGNESYIIPGEILLFYSMFSNLLKNAFEASPYGSIITINQFINNEIYTITIHNLGHVPEEIRDSFFSKYSSSGKKRGLGLGTYSAKLIAEIMNGSIQMESSEKSGTMITLKFKCS